VRASDPLKLGGKLLPVCVARKKDSPHNVGRDASGKVGRKKIKVGHVSRSLLHLPLATVEIVEERRLAVERGEEQKRA